MQNLQKGMLGSAFLSSNVGQEHQLKAELKFKSHMHQIALFFIYNLNQNVSAVKIKQK